MKEWLKNNIWPQEQVRDYMADTAIHQAQWIHSDGSKSLPEILAEYPRFLDTPGMVAAVPVGVNVCVNGWKRGHC